MNRITIVLQDQADGNGYSLQTDLGAPALGTKGTPAEQVAAALICICLKSAKNAQFGTTSATLAGDLVVSKASL